MSMVNNVPRPLDPSRAPALFKRIGLPVTSNEVRVARIAEYQKTKSKKLMDTILRENIKLVFCRIKPWHRLVADLDDLINEGILGLIVAIYRFDVSKGFKFSTYAVQWIDCKLTRYCEEHNNLTVVRRPCWKFSSSYWGQIINEGRDLSLNEHRNGDVGTEPLMNFIPDDRPLAEEQLVLLQANKEARDRLELLFKHLNNKERDIMKLRYFNNQTLQEIGNRYGVTREWIRQIEQKALSKIIRLMGNPRTIKEVHGSLSTWFHTDIIADSGKKYVRKVENRL